MGNYKCLIQDIYFDRCVIGFTLSGKGWGFCLSALCEYACGNLKIQYEVFKDSLVNILIRFTVHGTILGLYFGK